MRSLLGCCLFLVLLPVSAQTLTNSAPASASPAATNAISTTFGPISMDSLDDKHKLVAGDHLSFRVLEDRDDFKPIVVLDSGEIDVPYIGRVQVAGKTCRQLAMELKALLEKDYYYKATVLLSLDFFNHAKGKIYVVGYVRSQGPQDIPTDEIYTVSKAILKAGGFSDFANKREVKVVRKGAGIDDKGKTIIVDLVEILEKGKTDKDVVVQPDDYIIVQQRLVNF